MTDQTSPKINMAVLAEKLGISKSAVSRALRNDPRISEKQRHRVIELAQKMGYKRDPLVAELMSQLRKQSDRAITHTLAIIHSYPNKEIGVNHQVFPQFVEGIKQRAKFHGYGCDEFWLSDKSLTPARLDKILETRGIRAVVLVGLFEAAAVIRRYREPLERRSCVVAGARLADPSFAYCCSDHFWVTQEAMRRVVEMGYKRPALLISKFVDMLVGQRFSAAFIKGQEALRQEDRLPCFLSEDLMERVQPEIKQWIKKNRPDVLIGFNFSIFQKALADLGLKVPEDVGILLLDHKPRAAAQGCAYMHQHNEVVGEQAVDLLISLVNNHESGLQTLRRSAMVEADWHPGATLIDRTASKAKSG